jgi:hypothetical protein
MRHHAFRGCLARLYRFFQDSIFLAIVVATLIIVVTFFATQTENDIKYQHEQRQSDETSNDKSREQVFGHSPEWLTAVFTGALTISTIGLWGATMWLSFLAKQQARDNRRLIVVSRKSADAAKKSADTLVSTEKGFVFEKIRNHNFSLELGQMRIYDHPSGTWPKHVNLFLSFSFNNYGKTPIIINEIAADIKIKKGMASMVDGAYAVIPKLSEYVIAPQMESDIINLRETVSVSIDLFNDFVSGAADVWFIGMIEFYDIFNTKLRREFVWKYIRQSDALRHYQSTEHEVEY